MAFCTKCGSQYTPGESFCSECGAPLPAVQPVRQPTAQAQQPAVQQPVYRQPVQQQPVSQGPTQQTENPEKAKTNSMCSAGFVLSLIGMFLFGVTSLFGLIFSIFGLISAGRKKQQGKGKAIAGIIMSVLMIVILLVFFVFLKDPLMDKYEEKTGKTFPTRKVKVEFDDMFEEAGWVVAEDGTCIHFTGKRGVFNNYLSYLDTTDLYFTGHYELYNGRAAARYLAKVNDGAYFEDVFDVMDLYEEEDGYFEHNFLALTCVYNGFVNDGESQDIDPVTEHFYGFYVLIVEGEQVFDAIEMYNIESGSSFIMIKEDQFIDYLFAIGYDSAG